MQAFGAQALLHEGMDDGDIAVPHDPFRIFQEFSEPQPVDDPVWYHSRPGHR